MQRQVFCHLLFAENTERMDRQSDTFPRREAVTQKKTQRGTADTVYELHHTGQKDRTHRKSRMREAVFWRVFLISADIRERKP